MVEIEIFTSFFESLNVPTIVAIGVILGIYDKYRLAPVIKQLCDLAKSHYGNVGN